MSTIEVLKRANTLIDTSSIALGQASQIHDFLFGVQGGNSVPVAPKGDGREVGAPFFDSIINRQSMNDVVLNQLCAILETIQEKLSMKETRNTVGNKRPGVSGLRDNQLDKELSALVDNMNLDLNKGAGVPPRSI